MNKDIRNRLLKIASVIEAAQEIPGANIKTVQDIKREMEQAGSYFFSRDTMKFFGDTMKNFGARRENGKIIVYTKKPVTKHFRFHDPSLRPETLPVRKWEYDTVKKVLIPIK